MSEFERARERAERRAAKKQQSHDHAEDELEYAAAVEGFQVTPAGPVFKAPKKRSNEITVSVWIDGNEYVFSMKVNITGTILGGQQNRNGIQTIVRDAFRAKFGNVEMI